MKKIIYTPNAPAPIGPYSQAVRAGGMVFVSGQIAIDPQTNELVSGDVEAEAEQVMHNLKNLLQAAGLTFDHVVKSTIFLSSMEHFGTVNGIYGKYFAADLAPARETVAVLGLPRGVNVEISVIAVEPHARGSYGDSIL